MQEPGCLRSTVTGPDARVARLKVSDSRCKRTTTRIIVARRAPVLRGAIELSRALLRPSLRSVRRSAVGPGGRRARQDCGWNAAGIEPAVASGVHCVALRSRQSRAPSYAPAFRCARQAARLASTTARMRQSLRLVLRGGSANPAPVGRPAASVAALPAGLGPNGRALARNRAPRRRSLSRAVSNHYVSLKRLHGLRACGPPL